MHILLVDDDVMHLEHLRRTAEKISGKNYKISTARNKDEAIAAYAKYPIACALVDQCMRDVNGAELVDVLNALPRYASEEGEVLSFDPRETLPVAIMSIDAQEKSLEPRDSSIKIIERSQLSSADALDALLVELLKANHLTR